MTQDMLVKLITSALTSLVLLPLSCLSSGCSLITKEQGELGIRYGTEITFFHRAACTQCEAESRIEAPAILEWIIGDDDEVGPPAETETP